MNEDEIDKADGRIIRAALFAVAILTIIAIITIAITWGMT